ncbi:MAG: 50S ribosomal protein L4 [Armatimonadetes bacterium]|nr:50S ribosomal protein L4 [Armatimonadota bacterium]
MPVTTVYNVKGKAVGKVDLSDFVFDVPGNSHLCHLALLRQLAGKRRGTASTKTRAEVRGGGKKPWRQKGTGRARAGSIRSPIWKGGGVVFGPHPRDYSFAMPRKARKLALKTALSDKAAQQKLRVVDKLALSEPKTKAFLDLMKTLDISGKVLCVVRTVDENVRLASRNLRDVKLIITDNLNLRDLLFYETLLFDKDGLHQVEEVLQ